MKSIAFALAVCSIVSVSAQAKPRADRRVSAADRALAARLLASSKRSAWIDGELAAVTVIDEARDRVRVAQDIRDVRVALWIDRAKLVRVVTREVGIASTRDGVAPSGDEDGMYARPGAAVVDDAGARVAVHVHDGDLDVRGWVDRDAAGDVFDAVAVYGDAAAPRGSSVVDTGGAAIATVDGGQHVFVRKLGGARGALYGNGWVARGTLHLAPATPPPEIGTISRPPTSILYRGDCLFGDDGTLAGVMRAQRDDPEVDADGRVTIVADTAAGAMTLHAVPSGEGRFLSCAP